MHALDKNKTTPVLDTARQLAAILGLIVTMLGGALAVNYQPAWVMIVFGIAIFSCALFVHPNGRAGADS
jgi:hypothetical protein